MSTTSEIPVHRLAVSGCEIAVSARWLPHDPAATVVHLTDPDRSEEIVHQGRNLLYRTLLEHDGQHYPVMVKRFSHDSRWSRLRRRAGGSKATKSWLIARELQGHDVPTPEPILVIEPDDPARPSYFVSAALDRFFEMRYYFRALKVEREEQEFPEIDSLELFESLGRAVRRIHDAGVWHRDMTIGNLLVRSERGPAAPPTIYVVDLNRARTTESLTRWQRARDIGRLPIDRPPHLEAFLRAYWKYPDGSLGWRTALYHAGRNSFEGKNQLKAWIRRPGRALKRKLGPNQIGDHVPEAAEGSSVRDRAVWDALSDQPHQHASKVERATIRTQDLGAHLGDIGRALAAAPRVWNRYRALTRQRETRLPRPWGEPGVAIDGSTDDPRTVLELLTDLGVRRVLVRLQPWADRFDDSEELCRSLHRRGYELAFALPQDRDLVLDRARWRASIEAIADRFLPYGRVFQIGQAVNRSKWGIWKYDEFETMAIDAMRILRSRGDVEIIGPGVIDFELHVTMALANRTSEDYRFDGLASLLYVDRRGAPENKQIGFDTLGKVTLARAIAETSRSVGPRSWITEVNWPLFEGAHAPAGAEVAVGEPEQADYLTRYYLQTLASGMVERVYWWQLVAKGYGLVDRNEDGSTRRRAAFSALRTLNQVLEGSQFLGSVPAEPGAALYHFRLPDDDEVVAAWTHGRAQEADLPALATDSLDRDGREVATPRTRRIDLTGSPRYYRLERR